jgi:hypothetical protein
LSAAASVKTKGAGISVTGVSVTAFIRTLQKASSRYCRADLDIVLKPTKSMGSLPNQPMDRAMARHQLACTERTAASATYPLPPGRASNHKKSRLRESVGGFCCAPASQPARTRND